MYINIEYNFFVYNFLSEEIEKRDTWKIIRVLEKKSNALGEPVWLVISCWQLGLSSDKLIYSAGIREGELAHGR